MYSAAHESPDWPDGVEISNYNKDALSISALGWQELSRYVPRFCTTNFSLQAQLLKGASTNGKLYYSYNSNTLSEILKTAVSAVARSCEGFARYDVHLLLHWSC